MNDAPIANPDSMTVTEDQEATAYDVLNNDSDVDTNDTLSITALDTTSLQGSASLLNHQILYDPGSAFDDLAQGETAHTTPKYIHFWIMNSAFLIMTVSSFANLK